MLTQASHAGVEIAWRGDDLTGECPVWDDRREALWWTDIEGRRLHCLHVATLRHDCWPTPGRIGAFALTRSGDFVVGMDHAFAWMDAASRNARVLATPEQARPDNRFNDGCCDRQGRFLAGSMNLARSAATASLWCFGPDLVARELQAGVTVANGLAFNAEGTLMWWADSPQERIFQFPYDRDTGALGPRRVWLDRDHAAGRPDGGTVDADGCYWSARFGGGCVVRLTPRGAVDRVIPLPVSQVTMCTFGGTDYGTLFITTARNRLDAESLARQPLAGSVFAVHPGVRGVPPTRFAGDIPGE
jgi:sugar lactone lactonase YvrE